MPPLVLVMLGGAIGSGARHWTGRWMLARLGPDFPYGTLTVNLVGGFAMGVLTGLLARVGGNEPWRLLLGVGVLGGYTTFSSFSLDVVTLAQRGQMGMAAGYALLSVAGSIAALVAGLTMTRSWA